MTSDTDHANTLSDAPGLAEDKSEMPVREKVALMESWGKAAEKQKPKVPAKRSTSSSSTSQRALTPQPKVQYRDHIRSPIENSAAGTTLAVRPRRSAREARQRRSMSDPNLHKSFQAMKELWDNKVKQQADTNSCVSKPKSRGNSESSNSGEEINGKQPKEYYRPRLTSSNMVKEPRKGPPTPTKPKPTNWRKKEEHVGDVRKKAYSTADQAPAASPASVKSRAKMFDVSGDNDASNDANKTSLNRSRNRSTTVAGDESYARKSAIENKHGSPRRTVNNNESKVSNEETKSEFVPLLDYDESNDGKQNSEDTLMRNMRRNSANLAKERRRHIRRGSSHSDTDSNSSATSSLSSTSVEGPVVLRNHVPREDNASDKSSPSSTPIVKSYLHRRASPKNSNTPSSPAKPTPPKKPPRSGSIGSRPGRSGSMGSIEVPEDLFQPSAFSSRRQSSLHKDHSSSSLHDEMVSPTVALNRKLSIDAAKRVSLSTDSGTGTVSPGINRNSRSSGKFVEGNRDSVASAPDTFKRGMSFSSVSSLSKTPPPPPPSSNKPPRIRSSSSTQIFPQPVVRPSVPPPPPPSIHKRSQSGSLRESRKDVDSEADGESMGSTTTISSRMSLLSGLGDGTFNAEDEYNRILDVIATPTSTKRYRGDTGTPQNESEGEETRSLHTPSSPAVTRKQDSLEVPSQKSGVSDNDSFSDYDPSDADEEVNQISLDNSTENQSTAEAAPAKVPVEVKLHNIAKELLSTEATYVDVLHLIDQIFHKRVLEAIAKKQIPSDIKNIFSNVSAIYQFHSEFLLPQLKARLGNWEKKPKIGDIMTQAAPFLKMYSLYVQNFDEAMTMIKHWSEKSSNFANIIKQTQAMEECGSLSLEHHMLSPVQRIPRYKMLLEDYLKRLPEDAIDQEDAKTALQLISQAATHSNESMRQNDKFNRILNIYNNLVDINFDIVNVSRELIMEGKIIKISARNGEKHERYLYLFNDMLLCCTPQRRLQKKSFKVTAKIDLEGMEIREVPNMTIPNTFCVNGTNKSMEFATNSPEEKEKWVNAISDAIDAFLERKTSFMKSGSQRGRTIVNEDLVPGSPLHQPDSVTPLASPLRTPTHNRPISFEEVDTGSEEKRIEISCNPGSTYVVDIEDHDLGKRAPRWIKDNEVTMCMNCSKAFNRLIRRRHHCRACGRVICTECSDHKLELAYEPGKAQKVCNKCHAILTGRKNADGIDKKGVLQIEADIVSEGSIISEYLYFSESEKRKTWTKMWCVIPSKEPCLYVYGANQDVRATMTMPLLGFSVVDDNTIDREFSFKLVQARKALLFAAANEEQKNRWKYVFERVAVGEEVKREDVYNVGKMHEQLQEEMSSRLSMNLTGLSLNGSRLSSSSAESSNVSASTPSDSSSRPVSLMGANGNQYSDVTDSILLEKEGKNGEEVFQQTDSS